MTLGDTEGMTARAGGSENVRRGRGDIIGGMAVGGEHAKKAVDVRLRPVEQGDLPVLYEHQCDPISNEVAVANPRSAEAFDAHWTKIIADPAVVVRAVIADGRMVGYVSCFNADGSDYVGYWIARDHWGRGIATKALALLLEEVSIRPLYARVARSNVASLRVLERCGFSVVRYEMCEATERHPACEEAILILNRDSRSHHYKAPVRD